MTRARALRRVGRVLLAGAGERIRPPRALTAADVPRSPTDVGAEWLTSILCADTEGAHVRSVEVRAATAGTTTRAALAVTYDEIGAAAELPTALFVKCTSSVAQRLMLGLGGLIEREPAFYTHVRPTLRIEAPIGYFAAVDPRSWRSIVVIEDVTSTRGASFLRPSSPVGPEQVEDLLANVAAWHGALWDSSLLREWRWLKAPADQMRVIDSLISLADRTGAGAERARAVIPSGVIGRQDDLYEAMRRSMRLLSERPHTFLHGDLHIANTYATKEGSMGIADWQVGLRGSWAHDYAYLVTTALDIEDRRRLERRLLGFYLERLAAAGGGAIPPETAWMAYRQATFYPYFAWLYTIGRSRLQPSFQPAEVSLATIERISAAIDDLDSWSSVGL